MSVPMSYTVQSGVLIWLKVPTFGTNVCLAQEPWRFLTQRNVIKILFGELLIKKAAPGPSCDGPGAASRQRQRLGLFGASKRRRCSKRRLVAFNFDKAIRKILLGAPYRNHFSPRRISTSALRNLRVSRALCRSGVGCFTDLAHRKRWVKVKNPRAAAATRVLEGGF